MAKHDVTMPPFYMVSTPKCTGVGFTKWTSSDNRYRKFVQALLEPTGHASVFEVESLHNDHQS